MNYVILIVYECNDDVVSDEEENKNMMMFVCHCQEELFFREKEKK